MKQAIFKFEEHHDYTPDNFLVSGCNREAYGFITTQPWPFYAVNIYGPEGSGKTFLAQISEAEFIDDLNEAADEVEVLHKINRAREEGRNIILTSKKPFATLAFALPDLKSRLAAMPAIEIKAPDDELFRALLMRQFAARQLKIGDDILSYLVARVERSFEEVASIVGKIDELSLNEKRNITIPLIKSAL